jgi:hypothetical protein
MAWLAQFYVFFSLLYCGDFTSSHTVVIATMSSDNLGANQINQNMLFPRKFRHCLVLVLVFDNAYCTRQPTAADLVG